MTRSQPIKQAAKKVRPPAKACRKRPRLPQPRFPFRRLSSPTYGIFSDGLLPQVIDHRACTHSVLPGRRSSCVPRSPRHLAERVHLPMRLGSSLPIVDNRTSMFRDRSREWWDYAACQRFQPGRRHYRLRAFIDGRQRASRKRRVAYDRKELLFVFCEDLWSETAIAKSATYQSSCVRETIFEDPHLNN